MIRNLSRRTILTTALATPTIASARSPTSSPWRPTQAAPGGTTDGVRPAQSNGARPDADPRAYAGAQAVRRWPAMLETLERLTGGRPVDHRKFVHSQIALWKGVIDKKGLKLDANEVATNKKGHHF